MTDKKEKTKSSIFHIGQDIGLSKDRSTTSIIELIKNPDKTHRYFLSYLHAYPLGTEIPVIIDDLEKHYKDNRLHTPWHSGEEWFFFKPRIVLDTSGCGPSIVKALSAKGVPVNSLTITGGYMGNKISARHHSEPRNRLMFEVLHMLQAGRLTIAPRLPHFEELMKEASGLTLASSPSGRDAIYPRGANHDDLLIAVALALWGCRNLPLRFPPKDKPFK